MKSIHLPFENSKQDVLFIVWGRSCVTCNKSRLLYVTSLPLWQVPGRNNQPEDECMLSFGFRDPARYAGSEAAPSTLHLRKKPKLPLSPKQFWQLRTNGSDLSTRQAHFGLLPALSTSGCVILWNAIGTTSRLCNVLTTPNCSKVQGLLLRFKGNS